MKEGDFNGCNIFAKIFAKIIMFDGHASEQFDQLAHKMRILIR